MHDVYIPGLGSLGDTCDEFRPPGAANLGSENTDRFSLSVYLGTRRHVLDSPGSSVGIISPKFFCPYNKRMTKALLTKLTVFYHSENVQMAFGV
jgi:hypothetical protein